MPVAELKSAEMTGELEKTLNDIALGKCDYSLFIENMRNKVKEWYSIIAQSCNTSFVSEKEQKMICPLCHKKINIFDWGYSCSGYRDGCKFHINKTIAGKRITDNAVILLCQNGTTNIIKGFKSKNGNEFDAYLVVDKEKQEVSFHFPDKRKN